MNKKWLNRISVFTIGWTIALFLWRIIRNVGNTDDLKSFNIHMSSSTLVLSLLMIATIAGFIFGSVQYGFEKQLHKKRSFRRLLLEGLLIHMVVMLFLYLSIYVFFRIGSSGFDLRFKDFLTNPILLINLLYSLLINSVISIIIYLNKLLGQDNLGKLLTGRFSRPQEELRAFMFLDMVSSTSIAETLGHLEYSSLIQDCFHDLEILEKFGAEVYQYAGDEVVLTWPIRNDVHKTLNQSMKSYFAYSNHLVERSDYYNNRYHLLPNFTAGLHFGKVSVVEVGSLKREIAYHGDTLNIAARIQALCKTYNQQFVVSDKVVDSVDSIHGYEFIKVGAMILRGKSEETVIHSVTPIAS